MQHLLSTWPRASTLRTASVFLAILGASTLFVRHYGLDTPLWDQWDYEAGALYVPLHNGSFALSNLFAFHNEHRLFWSRLIALVQYLSTGAWDPLLQLAFNAVLHAALAALLAGVGARILGPKQATIFALACICVLSFPFGWENTLGGWGSQFYLLFVFGILSLACLARAPAFALLWWTGVGLGVAGYLCMASGASIAFAAAALAGIQLLGHVRNGAGEYVGVALLLAIGSALASDIPGVEHHRALRASTVLEFVNSAAQAVSWPGGLIRSDLARSTPAIPVHLLLATVLYAPSAVLLWHLVRDRAPPSRGEWIFIGLAGWVLLQALALALGRGGTLTMNVPRYTDVYVFGFLANLACALVLCQSAQGEKVSRWVLVWSFVFAVLRGAGSADRAHDPKS